MRKLLLILAATTLTASSLGGCKWRIHDSEEDMDEDAWWEDTPHDCDGSAEGEPGDSCQLDSDCGEGLTCDGHANVCVPALFESCSAHGDCLPGSYCAEDAGECIEADVCIDDGMCSEGYACLVEQLACMPEQAPLACVELLEEAACGEREDCEAKYVGVSCSCGSDCECSAGEEGCVCESFEFDSCADLAQ